MENQMEKRIELLILDDETIVCERLRAYLEKRGMKVEIFSDSHLALERVNKKAFDVVITDLRMEGPSGLDILKAVKEGPHRTEVIVITGYGSFDISREAEIIGAFEFIAKPFKMADMFEIVQRAANKARRDL